MRIVGVLSVVFLCGCIEDRPTADDSENPIDGGATDAQPQDGAPRMDQFRRDVGPTDAGRDSAPVIDRGPPNCDQPDPGACEAAGCQWSDLAGCERGRSCRRLPDADCNRSADCVLGPHPETGDVSCRPVDDSTCSGWSPGDCETLARCLVVNRTCIPAVNAPCGQVALRDCWRVPDCLEEFAAECVDQPKQQDPLPEEPDAGPQPEPEPEALPECFAPGDCGDGQWCSSEICLSCDVPQRCVDAP